MHIKGKENLPHRVFKHPGDMEGWEEVISIRALSFQNDFLFLCMSQAFYICLPAYHKIRKIFRRYDFQNCLCTKNIRRFDYRFRQLLQYQNVFFLFVRIFIRSQKVHYVICILTQDKLKFKLFCLPTPQFPNFVHFQPIKFNFKHIFLPTPCYSNFVHFHPFKFKFKRICLSTP